MRVCSFCSRGCAVQTLLAAGARTDAEHDERWTALHEAARAGHFKIAEVGLRHGDVVAHTV